VIDTGVRQQPLLGIAALPAQHLPLRQMQRTPCRGAVAPTSNQLLLHHDRQRQIEIVAAEEQVFANRDALEGKLPLLERGTD
jgi:hypothetical protein